MPIPGELRRAWRSLLRAPGFTLAFVSFDGPSLHNPLGLSWEGRATGFQPFTVADRNLALRFGASYREFRADFDQVDLDTEVRTTFGAWRPYVRHVLRRQVFERPGRKALDTQELTGGVMVYVNGPERLRRWLRGTLLQASVGYDLERSGLLAADFSLGRNVTPELRVEVATRHDFRGDYDRFEARVVWDHALARSTTVLRAGTTFDVTQSGGGTVGYADGLDDVVFSRRPAVGRAAASIRTFLDLDGDGEFDQAEPLVPNVGLRFDQPVVRQEPEPGILLVPDLVPYHRYDVEVDISRVRNPTWVPAFEEFGLELSPNWVRPIERGPSRSDGL